MSAITSDARDRRKGEARPCIPDRTVEDLEQGGAKHQNHSTAHSSKINTYGLEQRMSESAKLFDGEEGRKIAESPRSFYKMEFAGAGALRS